MFRGYSALINSLDCGAIYKQELVQRGHAFAIVDEVDSILIDEARTPLIISGKGEDSSQLYQMADKFVSTLRKQVFAKTEDKEVQDDYDCDYFVDEKSRTVSLTAEGIAKAEKFFGVEYGLLLIVQSSS